MSSAVIRRTSIVAAVMGVLTAACSGAGTSTGDPSASAEQTATTPPTTTSAASPGTSSTVASGTIASSPQASSTTTRASISKEFRFITVPPEGTFYNVGSLPQPIWGFVRPQAQVTVNGIGVEVFADENPGQPPDLYRWSTWKIGGDGEELLDVHLNEGPNVLVFEAVFADGSTERLERTVNYDPALQRSTGYIVDATLDPPTVTLEVATLEYGEFGIEQTSEDTTIAEFPVAPDALFLVLWGDHWFQGLDLQALAGLAEAAAGGDPLEGYLYRTIYANGAHTPAAWEFLVTPEGRLQQATQLYSP